MKNNIKEEIEYIVNNTSKSLIADEVLKVVANSEIEYWKNVFDNPPKRNKPYPCDNCTQNICRLEIEKWEQLLSNLSLNKENK